MNDSYLKKQEAFVVVEISDSENEPKSYNAKKRKLEAKAKPKSKAKVKVKSIKLSRDQKKINSFYPKITTNFDPVMPTKKRIVEANAKANANVKPPPPPPPPPSSNNSVEANAKANAKPPPPPSAKRKPPPPSTKRKVKAKAKRLPIDPNQRKISSIFQRRSSAERRPPGKTARGGDDDYETMLRNFLHPNEEIQQRWMGAGENAFDGLFEKHWVKGLEMFPTHQSPFRERMATRVYSALYVHLHKKLFSALPSEIRIRCDNEKVRNLAGKAARDVYEKLEEHNAIRFPKTDHPFQPLNFFKGPQVYCRFDKNDPSRVVKVGYTANIFNRYNEEERKTCFIMVCDQCISKELDLEIVAIVDKLLTEICNDKSLPYDFRSHFRIIRDRGGGKLGLKKNLYFQLIEIACQLKLGLDAPAEAFTTGEKVQNKRRVHVKAAIRELLSKDDLQYFRGDKIKIKVVATWATGKREDRLSSQVVASEYVAGTHPREDALPNPVNPNAKTVEEIYDTRFPPEEFEAGRQLTHGNIKETIADNGKQRVLLLCKNEEGLFPNDELLQILLNDYGFVKTHSMHDNRIVSLTHYDENGKRNAKVILYCPLGYAMDSRTETIGCFPRQLRTFLEIEILHKLVQYLSNEAFVYDTSAGDDAITAACSFESTWKFFHMSRQTAAAFARDVLTPDHIRACEQNGLQKQENKDHISPTVCRREARHAAAPETMKRQLDFSIVLRGLNILSFSKDDTIDQYLKQVDELFRKNDISSDVVGTRWKSFLKKIYLGEFKIRCQNFVDNLKANTGNRLPYKHTNVDKNEAIREKIESGIFFMVHAKQAETRLEKEFDPENFPHWNLFHDYDLYYINHGDHHYEGVRNHYMRRTIKGNTNHRKAPKKEDGPQLTIKKDATVYCCLDETMQADKPPKAVKARTRGKNKTEYKPPNGYKLFCYICHLSPKGEKLPPEREKPFLEWLKKYTF